jgi:PAS domain S-box-containing protein
MSSLERCRRTAGRPPADDDPERPAQGLAAGLLYVLATAACYAIAGWSSLRLAIPGGWVSPLYPSAGIALACVLTYGRRAALGVALGALIVNTLVAAPGGLSLAAVLVSLAIAGGASAQSLFAAALVRRHVGLPLALHSPGDIAKFLGLSSFVACLVSSVVGVAALAIAGYLSTPQVAFAWLTWWVGDSLGTLIAAPIALTLIGRPRDDWAPRRLHVGVPLALVTLLMGDLSLRVARWDDERLRANFEREAYSASSSLAYQLEGALNALEALRGIYIASGADLVTPEGVRRATQPWLNGPTRLYAMGYTERVPDIDPSLARAADGSPPAALSDVRTQVDRGRDMLALRVIEPVEHNRHELRSNLLSSASARAAIAASASTDRPAASAGFSLGDEAEGHNQTGVVIYHALYDGTPDQAQERAAAIRGAVFVALRIHDTLHPVLERVPAYLSVCLVDTDPVAPRRRLAGPAGCESQQAGLLHVRAMAFAGRRWDLRIQASPLALPGARQGNAWPFAVVGFLSAAVLGALMLTVTGRARRIELAVRERTAALTEQIREREQAEVAMRASEQRFRNIFNNVPIGVCYTDLQGRVVLTNPRFCEFVGHGADQLLQMSAAGFTHPDDLLQDRELTVQLIRGDFQLSRRQKRYIHQDGRTLWGQTTVSLLRSEDGEPWRIVTAVEDITEHLRLADAERAREAAEASNRAKSDFLSRMSHELRTPLNAMLGFAQLLELDQRHPLPDAQRPWVTQIQQAGWHLLEMINDALDLSRIESGNLRLAVEPLDLRRLLAAAITMVETDASRRRIVLTQDIPPHAALVQGDATRVKQILINLLSNAVKYNVDGGRIHVATRRASDTVELAVTDTGLGMTTEQMGELFQPFNRLGRERLQQEGTGIGLVISKRLAELMGGTLEARSSAGEGSSFILSLPMVSEPARSPGDEQTVAAGPADYHRRVVHYVEDNETNVEVMRGILAQRPQVELEVSVTGLDGLAAIRARRPDVILLDMHLPDINGMELLRHLKNDPATGAIPVVIVSADAMQANVEAASGAGASRYLTKPVSVTEMLGVIDEVLDRAETRYGETTTLEIGR